MTFSLLLVDDEPDVLDALRRALDDPRLEILCRGRAADAMALLSQRPIDLVIADLDMPDMHGLELLRRIRSDHPGTARMVLTGRASLEAALDAINQGEVHRFLGKPWKNTELREAVEECLARLAAIRSAGEADRRVAGRRELLARLERAFPGITSVSGDTVALDPVRLDAAWPPGIWSSPQDLHALAGEVLDGRYLLQEVIGSGGFGVVYRGLQLSLERPVAVKVLRATEPRPEQLTRFRLEALATCQVIHPAAVTVLDAGEDGRGLAYLVMELLDGETLAERLRRNGTLTFDAAARIAADVCAALAVAHAAGILHRDVKPANVFLHQGPAGTVTRLLDFGIAKIAARRSPRPALTDEDVLLGTPAYVAPERLGRGDVDGRADVYAVGVLLYEALAGVRPISGASVADVPRQHLTVVPRGLASLDPAVPRELDAMVTRMLAKDPEARPSAAEAASLLEELAARLPCRRMAPASLAASEEPTRTGLR